ncbi:MAG TPA: DUF3570 domain-containing protein [Polyangia bacterium]|nr:DUF3570 domain-containing protein [Polyangia bacterium]
MSARLGALALVCWSGFAHADDSFVAKTQVYVDNDHTTVVSPLAAISRDAWKGGTLNASYVADVVSSASIDVISNATKQMNDFRSEITAGLSQKLRMTTLSGSYIYSTENDYNSHNVDVGVSQDLFDRNSTLALGYTVSVNGVGRTGDQSFHRSLLVNGVGASWTQVLNKATIAQASFTFSYSNGYQASPYRFVRIETPDLSAIAFKVPETDPQDRFRYAFVIGGNRHLFSDTSLQADYRLYFDSWGIVSHTIQLRYFVTFKDVTLRLRERFYYQSGANFFKSHYTTDQPLPAYVTADRELSTFWSNVIGAKISWRLPWVHRALAVEAKADLFYFYYTDFALLSSRIGADLEAGISVLY